MNTTAQAKLFIVEDHEITRMGLQLLLEDLPDFELVGTSGDGQHALQAIVESSPTVVLMDLGLPGMDGISLIRYLKRELPETRIVVLTSNAEHKQVLDALDAGADGYCLKDVSSSQLVMAIRCVASGASWLHENVVGAIRNSCARMSRSEQAITPSQQPAVGILSEREIEVVRALSDGLSNVEIAERLAVSAETVKTHMRHIMEKLGVTDRTQAVVKAIRAGLIE